MKKSKPQGNPITTSLILLLGAQSFNDFWATKIGLPTPVQLVLIGTTIANLKYAGKNYKYDPLVKNIRLCLIIYFFVLLAYWLITLLHGDFNIEGISTMVNVAWIIFAMPLLRLGFTEYDWQRFKKYSILIIGLVTIPSGFYELVTHSNILDVKEGLAENLFYLRGLHIDKLEFGAYLSFGVFIGLSELLNKNVKRSSREFYIFLYLVVSGLILISFSFSTTSIFGLAAGILSLLLGAGKKKYIIIFLVLAAPIALIVKSNALFSDVESAYSLKYDRSVTDADNSNFRYLAFNVAIEEFLKEPFGHGMGQASVVIKDKLNLEKGMNTHNLFGNELLDYGIIGAIPLICMIVNVYRLVLVKKYRIKAKYHYSKILRSVALALSVFTLFRFLLYYHQFSQTFYLIWVSLAIVQYYTSKKVYFNESSNLRQALR